MTKLEQLKQELCPDGVTFVPLGDVARISNGKDHKHLADGDYPVFGSGGIMRYADQNIYDRESVLIPRKGSLGNIFFVDMPFWTVDTIFYTKISDRISPKFFYYYMTTVHVEDLNEAGGVPSLTKTILDKIQIPLPPLPIQREIVRILDNFTELTAELTAELTTRKKQYAYYRDKLLTFGDDVPMVALGEVCELVRGNGLQKKDFTESGVGCIHYGQIYTYYGTFTDRTKSFVSPELAKTLRKVCKGDLIITNTSENVEDVCKAVAWLGEDDIVTGGHATILKHRENPKYLTYYTQTAMFHAEKRKYAGGTKVIDVSATNMAKIRIPLPPLAEQERIANILDRFDMLTTDLQNGIPAEIAARKKQYEYYRDKLLTFKEKTA